MPNIYWHQLCTARGLYLFLTERCTPVYSPWCDTLKSNNIRSHVVITFHILTYDGLEPSAPWVTTSNPRFSTKNTLLF